MGCGTSNHVVAPATEEEDKSANGAVATNGHEKRDHGHDHDKYEHLPTVVLPETPAKPKPLLDTIWMPVFNQRAAHPIDRLSAARAATRT
ncbi:hypothetical protein EVAR_22692_1 [Eumeta japonica]|uniref:Uncharacterized protein n=1 Tax=Eumeta variegata TaxID=151549 RepID=A0A4C1US77_EUMVA|nr:hypothetical protein EVAR_22692_1 [Eumeta japonica]